MVPVAAAERRLVSVYRSIPKLQPERHARHARGGGSTANTGLSVWTDTGLTPGTPNWEDAIEEAVNQAKAMVVLLSPKCKTIPMGKKRNQVC